MNRCICHPADTPLHIQEDTTNTDSTVSEKFTKQENVAQNDTSLLILSQYDENDYFNKCIRPMYLVPEHERLQLPLRGEADAPFHIKSGHNN